MNPNTETQTTEAVAKSAKAKKAKVAKVTAFPVAPAANPARDALHSKVRELVKLANGQPADQALISLRSAMEEIRNAVPDIELSSNKEQRSAQLKALRETRAAMGCQVLARLVGDALASVPGAEQARRYSARVLVSGAMTATESIRTTVKPGKSFRGYSVR